MKPLLIKIDDVVLNLAHAGSIAKEPPNGGRPGVWWSIKTEEGKHLLPDELVEELRPTLLEYGWITIEPNYQEVLLNAAVVSEVVATPLHAGFGTGKTYTFYQGRGKGRTVVLSFVSQTDPLDGAYFSAITKPTLAPAPVAEKRLYTVNRKDRWGRSFTVQIDSSGAIVNPCAG